VVLVRYSGQEGNQDLADEINSQMVSRPMLSGRLLGAMPWLHCSQVVFMVVQWQRGFISKFYRGRKP